jgi:RecQ-mediated genome instability protein 1
MEILSRERILSPIGRGTHFPSSPSPPPPQTAHFPGTRPIAHLPKRSISNPKTNSKTTTAKDRAPSSDFDYDFGMDDMATVMDDAALEELDLIEVKASGSNFVSNSTNSNISVLGSSVSGGGSAYASVSAVGSGSGFGAPSTSISIPPPIQREPTRNVDSNIIIIDSDAEEDKENVPVPTRHVRRRTQQDMTQARGQPRTRLDVDVDDDDVIDISSE